MSRADRDPVACSLDAAGMAARSAEASELLRAGAAKRTVHADGSLVFVFRGPPALRSAVRDLVRRERECCPFFDFRLAERGDELTLTARAPEEGRALLEELFAAEAG